jgi:hypothetical protein
MNLNLAPGGFFDHGAGGEREWTDAAFRRRSSTHEPPDEAELRYAEVHLDL